MTTLKRKSFIIRHKNEKSCSVTVRCGPKIVDRNNEEMHKITKINK